MRVLALTVLMLMPSVVVSAQDGTPEAALVDLAMATDIKVAAKHFPLQLNEALARLSPSDNAHAQAVLLPMVHIRAAGAKVHTAEDGKSLLIFEQNERKIALHVARKISDGLTTMMRLELCVEDRCRDAFIVWMEMQDGEWRLTEIEEGRQRTRLDDPEFLQQFIDGEKRANEASAVGSLRTLVTSLVSYDSSYSGFPERMSALAGNNGEEPTAEHAMLVDPTFLHSPCIRSGYRFEYTLLARGGFESEGLFTITATPVEFGKTGSFNYFVDQSGVIRATKEDRLATALDPALQ